MKRLIAIASALTWGGCADVAGAQELRAHALSAAAGFTGGAAFGALATFGAIALLVRRGMQRAQMAPKQIAQHATPEKWG